MNEHSSDRIPNDLEEPLRQVVERIVSRPVPAVSQRLALRRAELVAGVPRRRRKAMLLVAGVAAATVAVLWW